MNGWMDALMKYFLCHYIVNLFLIIAFFFISIILRHRICHLAFDTRIYQWCSIHIRWIWVFRPWWFLWSVIVSTWGRVLLGNMLLVCERELLEICLLVRLNILRWVVFDVGLRVACIWSWRRGVVTAWLMRAHFKR